MPAPLALAISLALLGAGGIDALPLWGIGLYICYTAAVALWAWRWMDNTNKREEAECSARYYREEDL